MNTLQDMRVLLDEAKADGLTRYSDEWRARAVAALNEYYLNHDRCDDEIFDTSSEEWEELVKHQLESRGTQGLLYFLGKIEPFMDYAELDGYGNARWVSNDDMVKYLEWAIEELEKEGE